MFRKPEVHEILVLEPDRLRGAVIARTTSRLFPSARVYCESDPSVAAVLLAEHAIELFIVAVRGFDLDIVTLLGVWAEHNVGETRVLLMTPDPQSNVLTALRSLPINGVFDSSCSDLRELEFACVAVASGATYVSRSVRERQVRTRQPARTAVACKEEGSARAVRVSPPPRGQVWRGTR
jgi:hypothetical protein